MRNKSSPLLVGVSLGFQTGVAGNSAGSCGGGGNFLGESTTRPCVCCSPGCAAEAAGKGIELWRSHLLLADGLLLLLPALLMLLLLLLLLAAVVVAVE